MDNFQFSTFNFQLSIFNFQFSISYKHEVTPNEVPMAVKIVISVWIIIPQMSDEPDFCCLF